MRNVYTYRGYWRNALREAGLPLNRDSNVTVKTLKPIVIRENKRDWSNDKDPNEIEGGQNLTPT